MSTHTVERHFPEWTVADRLRRIRRDTGMTQGAFASRLQVKPERYSAWESGRNQPPMDDFLAVAKRIELAFGVAAEWTLGLATHETPRPDGPEGVDVERARRYSKPQPSDPKVLGLRIVA